MPSAHLFRTLCLAGALALPACKPSGESTPPPATEGEAASPTTDGSLANEQLTETLGERSYCRSGRIGLPNGGHLRAIADDQNGYSVLLPDLADWDMACGDDPYLVASAMGGAVNATVARFASPEPLDVDQYLILFGDQLAKDLAAEKMTLSDKKIMRTEADNWVLTFKVSTQVDDAEIWQFNYITARAMDEQNFVTLHMAVTARHNEGNQDAQIEQFADGLVTYMDLFRLDG